MVKHRICPLRLSISKLAAFLPKRHDWPEFTPDKVYPYVLALNESLTKADKGAAFTSGEYLYNQGANRFIVMNIC